MNKLLILVLILFLFLFKSKSNFGNTLNLYNGDKWSSYRLGDVYNCYQHVYEPDHPENVYYHKYKFKGSIANEYINKNTSMIKNKKLLLDIINSRIKDKFDYPDTLFLHIRVGDVICDLNDQ